MAKNKNMLEVKPEVLPELDKSKFVLVQSNEVIYDQISDQKPIGYFKDAWIRFKKNRVSVVAFIILSVLIIMSVIGPLFNQWNIDDRDIRLKELPPRIPLLEDIGIFDGTKVLFGRTNRELNDPNFDEDSIVLEYVDSTMELVCKPGTPIVIDGVEECVYQGEKIPFKEVWYHDIKVDLYLYRDYENSYGDGKYITLTDTEYDELVADDATRDDEDKVIRSVFNEITSEVCVGIEDEVEQRGEMVTVCTDLETGDIIPFTVTKQYQIYVNYWKYLGFEETPYFWFGTDGQGRDLFTLIWSGARVSFMVAFTVAFINIFIGVVVGAVSGYYGGRVDLFLQRALEIIAGVPFLATLTLLTIRFGSTYWVVILAFVFSGWIGISRTVRAQFFRYKNREYVLAARTLGAKDARLMARHIFPNAVGTIITSVVLIIPGVIFTESTFSFLGIIDYGKVISIGKILSNGQQVMQESPHVLLFPAIFISLLMLSFNMFGNGLRDAFNPSLRGVE